MVRHIGQGKSLSQCLCYDAAVTPLYADFSIEKFRLRPAVRCLGREGPQRAGSGGHADAATTNCINIDAVTSGPKPKLRSTKAGTCPDPEDRREYHPPPVVIARKTVLHYSHSPESSPAIYRL
jgi:hypothetical protein